MAAGEQPIIVDIKHHVPRGLGEACQDESEVVLDHKGPLSVEAEEVIDVAQEAAGRLDLQEQPCDLIVGVNSHLSADSQKLECDAVTSLGLPPTPRLLHAYIDIKSTGHWSSHPAGYNMNKTTSSSSDGEIQRQRERERERGRERERENMRTADDHRTPYKWIANPGLGDRPSHSTAQYAAAALCTRGSAGERGVSDVSGP